MWQISKSKILGIDKIEIAVSFKCHTGLLVAAPPKSHKQAISAMKEAIKKDILKRLEE